MPDTKDWSWETEKRLVADLKPLGDQVYAVHEPVVSPDGEKIAVAVEKEPDSFRITVNTEPWADEFEKAWHLKFSPSGQAVALVRVDDEWTVAVDGALWDERWEFAWNTCFNVDGSTIAVQIKDNMEYTVAVNGQAWQSRFHASRGLAVSADGSTVVAPVQVVPLAEADTVGFFAGTWSLAVNGEPWEKTFVNLYSPVVNADGSRVAAEVRLDICEYTLADNGEPWAARFGGVWEPILRPGGQIVAPVRLAGSWTLAENGEPIWKNSFMQLWNQRLSPDGNRLAAVVAPSFGRWTVAVDDVVWPITFGDMVRAPVFSADGTRVAAAVRDQGAWRLAVDGALMPEAFDMVWDPVFSPDGTVAAKVERDGRYAVAVGDKIWSPWYEGLWEPVFNEDGSRVLLRFMDNGCYHRQVVAFGPVFQG